MITPLKESEDAEDTTQTDETSADTSYEEDSETSAQPYEDTAIDTTDIYDWYFDMNMRTYILTEKRCIY